jgi:hypothetical protein
LRGFELKVSGGQRSLLHFGPRRLLLVLDIQHLLAVRHKNLLAHLQFLRVGEYLFTSSLP